MIMGISKVYLFRMISAPIEYSQAGKLLQTKYENINSGSFLGPQDAVKTILLDSETATFQAEHDVNQMQQFIDCQVINHKPNTEFYKY